MPTFGSSPFGDDPFSENEDDEEEVVEPPAPPPASGGYYLDQNAVLTILLALAQKRRAEEEAKRLAEEAAAAPGVVAGARSAMRGTSHALFRTATIVGATSETVGRAGLVAAMSSRNWLIEDDEMQLLFRRAA